MRKIYVGDIKAYGEKNVCNVIYRVKWKDLGEARHKTSRRIILNATRKCLCFILGTIGVIMISSQKDQHKSDILDKVV